MREMRLKFPLGGVSRRVGYGDQERPYVSPWAVNTWGVCALENRERGGVRPGLTKAHAAALSNITGLFAANVMGADGSHKILLLVISNGSLAYIYGGSLVAVEDTLLTETGDAITDEEGNNLTLSVLGQAISTVNPMTGTAVFSAAMRGNKLYIADSTLKTYDPNTGVVEAISTAPANQPIVAMYRDRIFLAGANHVWYASRTAVPSDFNLMGDFNDDMRAVAGQVGRAGEIGSIITAMIPDEDNGLVFATKGSIHLLLGEPTTGQLEQISDKVGVISPEAYAVSPDGAMAFLSFDGVYLWKVGSKSEPTRFSEERIPERLRDVDPATNTILMEYDARFLGYHLFITPNSGNGTHWWLDVKNKALWPIILPSTMQPVASCSLPGTSAVSDVILGCKDGYLRKFSRLAANDDGTNIASHVIIGPFRLSEDDSTEGRLAELSAVMAEMIPSVTWRAFTGRSAEVVGDQAVAAMETLLASGSPAHVKATGTWNKGYNRIVRPRSRGVWCAILISSAGQWAYESVAAVTRSLGRLR